MCYVVLGRYSVKLPAVAENKVDETKEAKKLHIAEGKCRVDNSPWVHKATSFMLHFVI